MRKLIFDSQEQDILSVFINNSRFNFNTINAMMFETEYETLGKNIFHHGLKRYFMQKAADITFGEAIIPSNSHITIEKNYSIKISYPICSHCIISPFVLYGH